MCGLYALTLAPETVREAFGVEKLEDFPPRPAIRPGEPALVIRRGRGGGRAARLALWGFVPHWMKQWPTRRPINARAETLFDKPFFRAAARHRRCFLPASGFHEWRGPRGRRRAWLFTPRDGAPLAMAGLREVWLGADGTELETTVVITVPAGPDVAPFHDRMPALLPPSALDVWLDPAAGVREAAACLQPAPAGLLEASDAGNPLKPSAPPEAQGRLL